MARRAPRSRSPETSSADGLEEASAQLFDRPGGGQRALLVHLDDGRVPVDEALTELRALAESAGDEVVEQSVNRRRTPAPQSFLGKGKVEALRERLLALEADLVLVNHNLSPAQERNLERLLQCQVLDRVGLILDIFAQRARSHEGKLQVELAQLRHMASRLVRGWSHLERQSGGIGTRGPGETQLEMDRRMIGGRIKQLEKRLERVRRQRQQGRQARQKRERAAVSVVGYTNAGKSTLFNRLAESDVHVADQLFATLDTTLRRIELPGGERAIFADTVGFIRDLPPQLVAAFRSTLEEVSEADLLLHVIDAADPARGEQITQVESTLGALDAGGLPVLRVYNKIDQLDRPPRIERDADGTVVAVWLSSAPAQGLDLLLDAVAERVGSARASAMLRVRPDQGRLRARLYDLGDVLEETATEEGGYCLTVSLPWRELQRLYRKEGLSAELERG